MLSNQLLLFLIILDIMGNRSVQKLLYTFTAKKQCIRHLLQSVARTNDDLLMF